MQDTTETRRLTRQELYDLVWAEPVQAVASKFGVSDVALSKTCRRHGVPVPPRGYWAKLQAGKAPPKEPLPPRLLGASEIIWLGGQPNAYWRYDVPDDLMTMEIPPPPEFAEPMSEVLKRARRLAGRVAVPRDFSKVHKAVKRLLLDDEKRRTHSSKGFSWDRPYYDSPFEQRRLRLLNAICMGLQAAGARVISTSKKNPSGLEARVGEQGVWFTLDFPGAERSSWVSSADIERPATDPLRFEISCDMDGMQTVWDDAPRNRIERHVTEMVVTLLVAGELRYRRAEVQHHEWLVKRKAQLIEDERRRVEEEKRLERERQEREEQARIDRLFAEADALRQAGEIRNYVKQARDMNHGMDEPVAAPDFDRWATWALAQADRIDPVISRRFVR